MCSHDTEIEGFHESAILTLRGRILRSTLIIVQTVQGLRCVLPQDLKSIVKGEGEGLIAHSISRLQMSSVTGLSPPYSQLQYMA
jgi:hypothetical protein